MKKILFNIREFAWMVADEIADWLYPYRNRLTPEERFEVRVKDPYTEEIVAIRSNQWRIWDFMWGIHIMDWNERDDIGNIFLKLFSILALISALSGVYLFFVTNKR